MNMTNVIDIATLKRQVRELREWVAALTSIVAILVIFNFSIAIIILSR